MLGYGSVYEGLMFNGFLNCHFCGAAMKKTGTDDTRVGHFERFECTNPNCHWSYEVYADYALMKLSAQWILHTDLEITREMRYEDLSDKDIDDLYTGKASRNAIRKIQTWRSKHRLVKGDF